MEQYGSGLETTELSIAASAAAEAFDARASLVGEGAMERSESQLREKVVLSEAAAVALMQEMQLAEDGGDAE